MEQGFVFNVFGTFLSSRSIGTFKGVQRDKGLHGWEREGSTAAAAAPEIYREKKIRQYVRYVSCITRRETRELETYPYLLLILFYSLLRTEDMFVPSTLQIIRESELSSPPNKRRKKLQK